METKTRVNVVNCTFFPKVMERQLIGVPVDNWNCDIER